MEERLSLIPFLTSFISLKPFLCLFNAIWSFLYVSSSSLNFSFHFLTSSGSFFYPSSRLRRYARWGSLFYILRHRVRTVIWVLDPQGKVPASLQLPQMEVRTILFRQDFFIKDTQSTNKIRNISVGFGLLIGVGVGMDFIAHRGYYCTICSILSSDLISPVLSFIEAAYLTARG